MELTIHENSGNNVAELLPKGLEIHDAQEVLDLMMEAGSREAYVVMIHESSLPQSFFDLKTGLAGEIAQKAVNYRFRLLLIADLSKFSSKSLNDYIRESNRGNSVNFFATREEALSVATQKG